MNLTELSFADLKAMSDYLEMIRGRSLNAKYKKELDTQLKRVETEIRVRIAAI